MPASVDQWSMPFDVLKPEKKALHNIGVVIVYDIWEGHLDAHELN
jgi:hypothetical protein